MGEPDEESKNYFITLQLAELYHCTPWEVEQAEHRWKSAGVAYLGIKARANKRRQ
jgi:hypothetical protein